MAAGIKASTDGLYGTLQVNGADIVTFNDSGNVGIGTSSPSQKLTVSAAVGDTAAFVSTDTNMDIYLKATGTTLGNTRLRATGGDMAFITGLNERARIDSSGNFQVSTGNIYTTATSGIFFTGAVGNYGNGIYGTGTNNVAISAGGSERMRIDSAGQMSTTNGAGAVALAYDCRAWVNFNGTGTVAIRASGNVSSITDNGTGNYTLNFTNAMPDVNYSVSGCATGATISTMTVKILSATSGGAATLMSTTALQIGTGVSGTSTDATVATVAIFR